MRQLSRWLPARPDAHRQDVAERLGQWLHVAQAIHLHAAHGKVSAAGPGSPADPAAGLHQGLQQELERVREMLTRSITAHQSAHGRGPMNLDAEFALYHQRLNDLQRRMEMGVDALRQHVRQQVARSCPELAAWDAVVDQLFAGREQRLLSTMPTFLKARFVALRQEALASPVPDDLSWLQAFATEFEQTLLAELDLRLLPVVGLIETLEP